MRRLGAVGLLLLWLGLAPSSVRAGDWRTPTRPAVADVATGGPSVSLGRPQTIAEEPATAELIRQISFADIGVADLKPVPPPPPTTTGFASRAPAWPTPPTPPPAGNVWGSGFATNEPALPTPRTIASAGPEPIPAPKSAGTPIASSESSSCCGDGFDGCCCLRKHCFLPRLAECLRCGPWDRFYASTEYLSWWIKSYQTPPLLTTGPAATGGVIGAPGTSVVFGGSVSPDVFSGMRTTLGIWLDPQKDTALETTYLFLGQRSKRFTATSADFPVLTRPFFSINSGTESGVLLASPGLASSAGFIDAPSRFWDLEMNLRCNLWQSCNKRLDAYLGFRYMELQEGLNIISTSQDLTGTGTMSAASDNFNTFNQFYGPQIGVKWEWKLGRWSLDMGSKIAFGDSHRTVNIFGNQVVTGPGGTTTANAGILALPSNSGHFHDDRFAVVPEASFNVGYQVTDGLRLFVGYTFVYWSTVFRPGDQIDRAVDASQIPNFTPPVPPAGQTRPLVPLKGRDFWAQGMNVGLEYRY